MCISTFLLWKQLGQIVGWTLVSLMTLTYGSWSEGHHDLHFTVHGFCLISWRLFDVWILYFGIISQYDLMFDCKINVGHCDLYFMVQWFLPYILKTVCSMNIILHDYESVWPDIWPKNKCRSLWPIFHGPVIMPYILKTIWYMNTVFWDYESVWPNVWPKNKCRSLWPIFHGSVILPYILKAVLMYEHHTSGLWVSMIRHLTSK